MYTIYHLQRPHENGCGLTKDEWYELAHVVPYRYTSQDEIVGQIMAGAALLAYAPVAQVEATDIEDAWTLTQNAVKCWSMDHDPRITLLTDDLPVIDGKTYGLRSTSVGDLIMDGEGAFHLVAPVGFKSIPNPFTVAA